MTEKLDILLVGGGGRENALARALAKSAEGRSGGRACAGCKFFGRRSYGRATGGPTCILMHGSTSSVRGYAN